MTENIFIQEKIQAPPEFEHPIMEDTQEREEASHQDEPCLVVNSFISSNDILHDPKESVIPAMNHINEEVTRQASMVCFLLLSVIFSLMMKVKI